MGPLAPPWNMAFAIDFLQVMGVIVAPCWGPASCTKAANGIVPVVNLCSSLPSFRPGETAASHPWLKDERS